MKDGYILKLYSWPGAKMQGWDWMTKTKIISHSSKPARVYLLPNVFRVYREGWVLAGTHYFSVRRFTFQKNTIY